MAPRSPARWMAPIALLAAVGAVGLVVKAETGGGSDAPTATSQRSGTTPAPTGARTTTAATRTTSTTETTGNAPRTYTVKPGDTLGSISEATGISVQRLQELNPSVDPQNLTVGQVITLRP